MDWRERLGSSLADHTRVLADVSVPGRDAAYGNLERPLPPEVETALQRKGISALFGHQVEALNLVRRGQHVAVATSTASGKSAVYLAAALEEALAGGTTLYLSPTRALAADQFAGLEAFEAPYLNADVYDGDTPKDQRAQIRRSANFILTNPDMLHLAVLPNHSAWSSFLRRLKVVAVDEAHIYRGVFGSHVGLVLRRLRRLAHRYGSDPVFVFATATIDNPAAHASKLIGDHVEAVTVDGAPAGARNLIVAEPVNADGSRASANSTSAKLLADLVSSGVRTLAFSRSRVNTELVSEYARQRLPAELKDRVCSYRAGYLLEERREIERDLRSGQLLGVSTTSALELGIDIGDVDAVVLNGFPGTVSSVRQRAGRAGRSGEHSTAVMVIGEDPLDAWWAQHADELWLGRAEAALVNPSNPFLLPQHLECAAWELPLTEDTGKWFGSTADETVTTMVDEGHLRQRRGRTWFAGSKPPAPEVDLRSAGGRPVRIVESATGRLIATTDNARARSEIHPGAVHLHRGDAWSVLELDLENGIAIVEPARRGEYTQARTDTDVVVGEVDAAERLGRGALFVGSVEVTNQVVGFERKRTSTGEVIERVELDMPPAVLITRAVWYTLDFADVEEALERNIDPEAPLAGLHAAEHAGIGLLPRFALCDRWDLGGLSMCPHPDTQLPTWFIYDGYPGGAGLCDHAFLVAPAHLSAVRELINRCDCEDGCPRCVQSPKCGNGNDLLDPRAAVALLDLFLE